MPNKPTTAGIGVVCGAGLLLTAALVPLHSNAQPAALKPTAAELSLQVEQVDRQVNNTEENLKQLQARHAQTAEPSTNESLLQRFTDGEIQYLLEDYAGATHILYDVISDERFKDNPKYPDALFYLSESLVRQKNLPGARLYLKQLLELDARNVHHKESLARFLEISSQLDDYSGIDEQIRRAKATLGQWPKELTYAYGKWLLRHDSRPKEASVAEAQQRFSELAAEPSSPLGARATYFLGTLAIRRGDYPEAKTQFEKVVASAKGAPDSSKLLELAHLSLGRLAYEAGDYQAALSHYQRVDHQSENFADSLYETAWVHVRRQDWERAKNAADLCLLVSPDSTLSPSCQILLAHLLLKLQHYPDANQSYGEVIDTFAPARLEMDTLLSARENPLLYFESLLEKGERQLDISEVLPPLALRWAKEDGAVASALRTSESMETSQRVAGESKELAARILKALDERGLQAFPAIQEGYLQTQAADTALVKSEQSLLRIEAQLADEVLTPLERAQAAVFIAQLDEISTRFSRIPASAAEVEARRLRMRSAVDVLDHDAFKLGFEIAGMRASSAAVQKLAKEIVRAQGGAQEEEKTFLAELSDIGRLTGEYQGELDGIRSTLQLERAAADAHTEGERALREEVRDILGKLHQLLAVAEPRLPAGAADAVVKSHRVRSRIEGLRNELGGTEQALREKLKAQREEVRKQVVQNQRLLDEYTEYHAQLLKRARGIVGEVALGSTRRVRNQFYDFQLKADVGLVDVAFTRKQDRTQQIQQLSIRKDAQLRALDEQFKEVLRNVD